MKIRLPLRLTSRKLGILLILYWVETRRNALSCNLLKHGYRFQHGTEQEKPINFSMLLLCLFLYEIEINIPTEVLRLLPILNQMN